MSIKYGIKRRRKKSRKRILFLSPNIVEKKKKKEFLWNHIYMIFVPKSGVGRQIHTCTDTIWFDCYDHIYDLDLLFGGKKKSGYICIIGPLQFDLESFTYLLWLVLEHEFD